jgi:MFS family permease
MFIAAIIGLSISLIGLYVAANSLVGIVCMVLLFFVAFNYLEASLPALVSRITPPGHKGSAMGIYSSSQFFGAFLGGIIGGFVAGMSDPQLVFVAAGAMGIIWLLIAWGMKVPQRSKPVSIDIHCEDEGAAEALADRLVGLDGVLEATVMFEENRCYLKVDEKTFDLDAARAIAGSA